MNRLFPLAAVILLAGGRPSAAQTPSQPSVGAAPIDDVTAADPRLEKTVTLAVKGQSMSDICAALADQTGVRFASTKGVADDKVTIFCTNRPARDVMRQVARLFNFIWRRSGEAGAYHYDLDQTLKARLAEEEMRNKDSDEALAALEAEMDKYRPLLDIPVDNLKAMAVNKTGADKDRLENLSSAARGAISLWFQLGPDELDGLRSGDSPFYIWQAAGHKNDKGSIEMSEALAKSTREGFGDMRAKVTDKGGYQLGSPEDLPDGVPMADLPEARPIARLVLNHTELGRYDLEGNAGAEITTDNDHSNTRWMNGTTIGTGISPSVATPDNATANAALANDPALKAATKVVPTPSARLEADPEWEDTITESEAPADPGARGGSKSAGPAPTIAPAPEVTSRSRDSFGNSDAPVGDRVSSADVLEAFHNATGLDVIGDFYSRLFGPGDVTIAGGSRFTALNHLADTMHARWSRPDGWIAFRDANYFNERLKEVPNRLLAKWSGSRRKNGALTLGDLSEIAALTDVQLDSDDMADGARGLWHLSEWNVVRQQNLRSYWRLLAGLTPLQLSQAASGGVAYERLPPALQEKFVALALHDHEDDGEVKPERFAGATARVAYTPLVKPKGGGPEKGSIAFIYRFATPSPTEDGSTVKTVLETNPHGSRESFDLDDPVTLRLFAAEMKKQGTPLPPRIQKKLDALGMAP